MIEGIWTLIEARCEPGHRRPNVPLPPCQRVPPRLEQVSACVKLGTSYSLADTAYCSTSATPPSLSGRAEPMRGSTFKRCGRRDPESGKQLGSRCPKLKQRRHGAWWARYDEARGTDGRRRQQRLGTFATEHEAEQSLADVMNRIHSGPT
jgi:hypothetical protein